MFLTNMASFVTSVLMYTHIYENLLSELFNGLCKKLDGLQAFNVISFTTSIQH